ncbi:(6-4)DNA photolyase, partial [Cucurbita argyrosperma subsp. sororia]
MESDPSAFFPRSFGARLNCVWFLLESLVLLDLNLEKLGSHLLVFHEEPSEVLICALTFKYGYYICYGYFVQSDTLSKRLVRSLYINTPKFMNDTSKEECMEIEVS